MLDSKSVVKLADGIAKNYGLRHLDVSGSRPKFLFCNPFLGSITDTALPLFSRRCSFSLGVPAVH